MNTYKEMLNVTMLSVTEQNDCVTFVGDNR